MYLMINKTLSSEFNTPHRKINVVTGPLDQYREYETEAEVSTSNEQKDCIVVFGDMLENRQKIPFF